MDGLNKRFNKNPEGFLHEIAIVESLRHTAQPPPQGIAEFDLEYCRDPDRRIIRHAAKIGAFDTRGKDPSRWTHRIRAYWLPWAPEGTSTIQLGGQADYFFTSQLAGCQIRIVPGPYHFGRTNHPRVLHIAGNVTSPDDPRGTVWRNQQAQGLLTAQELQRSRALTSTGPGGTARGYQGEGVNVVGFKKRFRWQFWGQQVDFDDLTVDRVWQIR